MNKTKIEWTDYTWNPIKGLCPVGCWYCYARRMYQRFGWNPEVRLDGELFGSCQDAFFPNIRVYEILNRINPGSKVFICSTCELFHPKIYKEWRDAIFQAIKENPQHTFQILTKFPQNINRTMPDNVWLGVTVEGDENLDRVHYLLKAKAKIKFISYEPLLSYPAIPGWGVDWIIVGRLTGYGKKYDPPKRWLESLVKIAMGCKYSVFLKNNLKEIWGEPLIQEMPQ